jgi:hypothetical protein
MFVVARRRRIPRRGRVARAVPQTRTASEVLPVKALAYLTILSSFPAGCLPTGPADDTTEVVVTDHFEFFGVGAGQRDWYEAYARSFDAERFLGPGSRIRVYGYERADCPRPYCVEEGFPTIACHALTGDCMRLLARVLVDRVRMPLLFRDAFVEVASGGLGHGDGGDLEVDRSRIDMARLMDDREYTSALALSGDSVGWQHDVERPAADFVRFVIDRLGGAAAFETFEAGLDPSAWEAFGGLEAALGAWRTSGPRVGRIYRLPLAECAIAYRYPLGHSLVPTYFQSLIYAPEAREQFNRVATANFEIPADTLVTVEVDSGVGAPPFFRVEGCDDVDPGPFMATRAESVGSAVVGSMALPAGRYFVVAGSDGTPAEAPEAIAVKAAPP